MSISIKNKEMNSKPSRTKNEKKHMHRNMFIKMQRRLIMIIRILIQARFNHYFSNMLLNIDFAWR